MTPVLIEDGMRMIFEVHYQPELLGSAVFWLIMTVM